MAYKFNPLIGIGLDDVGEGGGAGTPGGSDTQIQYNDGGSFAGLSTLTTDGTNITLSGQWTSTLNGAASAPPVVVAGSWFTGGTSTTTKPQFLIEPSGTTSTAWSTAGTGLGVNAPSGFSGNLLDLQRDGQSRFYVDCGQYSRLFLKGAQNFGVIGDSQGQQVWSGNNNLFQTNSVGFYLWNAQNILQFITNGQVKATLNSSGVLNLASCPEYADDSAAGTGGLVAGDVYKTSTGELRIKL